MATALTPSQCTSAFAVFIKERCAEQLLRILQERDESAHYAVHVECVAAAPSHADSPRGGVGAVVSEGSTHR